MSTSPTATSTRPATLGLRLREMGGYGAATSLLVATLIGAGFVGRGPAADGIVLVVTVGALVVVLGTATARGRARLAIIAGAGWLAAIVVAVHPVEVRPFLGLAWLTVLAISTIGLVAVAADVLGARRLTFRALGGTICLYVLLGFAWATSYALIEAISGVPFLAKVETSSYAEFLYFSFATITTTGYGDVTVGENSWRLFVVSEALVGQLYLVVVIGALVGATRIGSLGAGQPAEPAPEERPGGAGVVAPPGGRT